MKPFRVNGQGHSFGTRDFDLKVYSVQVAEVAEMQGLEQVAALLPLSVLLGVGGHGGGWGTGALDQVVIDVREGLAVVCGGQRVDLQLEEAGGWQADQQTDHVPVCLGEDQLLVLALGCAVYQVTRHLLERNTSCNYVFLSW